jgi:hypothetical protein
VKCKIEHTRFPARETIVPKSMRSRRIDLNPQEATLKQEEIVRKFIGSKIFDFSAFAKFVAENGEAIATSPGLDFGFVIGHHAIAYCIPPQVDLSKGINPGSVRSDVTGT